MNAPGRIRAIALSAVLGALACLPSSAAMAQAQGYMRISEEEALGSNPVYLGVNKSMVVDLPAPAGDVLVSNPQIADAVLRTSTRLYLIGASLGQASVFLFDNAGAQIANFDIYVEADLSALNQLLAEAITDGYVRAEAINGSIVLRGEVASSTDASRAVEITSKMIAASPVTVTSGSTVNGAASATSETYDPADGPGIVNLLTIAGEEQVALKVTIAEVQREVVKQLGINVAGLLNDGGFSFGTLPEGLSPISEGFVGGGLLFDFISGNDSVTAVLRALDETNMIRTLAEPTLVAVSGETADFLAGGEFPFRECEDQDDGDLQCSIEFKPFGVQLAFTPVVLSQGRISLKVRAEVSEIVDIVEGIPALSSRRAETTVELPSGGAFSMAGMIQQNTRRAANGFPGLSKLPILGALFSSKDFQDRETELVMIVTTYLLKPTSPQALTQPDENMFNPDDAEAYFLHRLTKVYGTDAQAPGGAASAQVGFTFD